MQKIKRCLACGLSLATLSFTTINVAFAAELSTEAAVTSILCTNAGFYKTKDGVQIDMQRGTTSREWYDICNDLVNKVFRGCDAAEMGSTAHYYDPKYPDKYSFLIRINQVAELARRQSEIDQWVKNISPTLFANGMSKDNAIQAAYTYIVDNFPYDYELAASGDQTKARGAQGAYYAIKNQKGICASLTKLFRVLVESIPFDAEENVNWDTENPAYITVTIMSSPTHEWAAIKLDDSTYYYDCSGSITGNHSSYKMTLDELTDRAYAVYYDLANTKCED